MSVRFEIPNTGTSTQPALPLSQHVISANYTITDGYAAYIATYIEIAAGTTIEIGVDSDLEIG